MSNKLDLKNLRAFRLSLNLNQEQFWTPLNVTQSGGSRYESGRKIPGPLQHLLVLVYGTEKDSQTLLAALRTTTPAPTAE